MDKNFLKQMAQKVHINPSNDVLASLENEYLELEKNIDLLKKINVENIEPLTRICPKISFDKLRDDVIDKSIYLDKQTMLNNAKEKNDDFVLIKRIIK